MTPMTKAQSDAQLVQLKATYRGVRDGVEWWWVAGQPGYWVGRRTLADGRVEVGSVAASACNC